MPVGQGPNGVLKTRVRFQAEHKVNLRRALGEP